MAYQRDRISSLVCGTAGWMGSPGSRGRYVGPVPGYGVLDLNGSYRLTSHITAGVRRSDT